MKTPIHRAFNSTVAGQKIMCADAGSRAVVSMLNSKVRSLGGAAWHDDQITKANDATLRAIRDDLLPIYNSLVSIKIP